MSAASTSAAGSIQVEVQDEQRRPLDGFALADMAPWYDDALDAPVAWKEGGLSWPPYRSGAPCPPLDCATA